MAKKTRIRVGDIVPIWWKPKGARVLKVLPYTGKYPQWFSRVLRLEAPRTSNGWADVAWE
jgi:hypothetical protein